METAKANIVDIVVAGAGGCGMLASLVAAERGANVLLLEKDWSKISNTEISSFTVAAADTRLQRAAGVEDSAEAMAEDILRKNHRQSDPEVTLALCRISRDVVHWLIDRLGYNLQLAKDFRRVGQSVPRLHSEPESEGGRGSIRVMKNAVKAHPRISIADKSPGRGLMFEGGALKGVACDGRVVRARKVILACGGFGANPAMVEQHCPEAAGLAHIGAQTSTGEGILWGADAGAALDHMSSFQGHAQVVADFLTRLSPGIPLEGGIIVNLQGRRFAREDVGYSEFAPEIARQPGARAIEIFDERILRFVERDPKMVMSKAVGAYSRYATLEELAHAFGLDATKLRDTVDAYYAAAAKGVDEFGRTIFGKPLAPPYYAAKLIGGLAHTQGGLRVDSRARVLRPDGSAIENLYAGGGVACGVSGDGVMGYSSGNGLLATLGFAMIAGKEASA